MHIHIPLAARRGRRLENALSLQCDQGAGARIEIVKRRIAFDDDPERFVDGFVPLMSELARRIALARRRITEVFVSDDQRIEVAANGTELKLEGLRAELAVIRTARCAAALDGRSAINERDLQEAWRLCLGHRRTNQSGASKPPSSAPATRPPSIGNRPAETSSAPMESRPEPKVLVSFQPWSHLQFLNWAHGSATDHSSQRGRLTSRQVLVQPRGPIAWLETLMVSIRSGWLDDLGPMRLRYRTPSTRENFWCFLDASRSTGMNQFLELPVTHLPEYPREVNPYAFISSFLRRERFAGSHVTRAGRLFRRPWSCFGKPAERALSSKELLCCTAGNYEREAVAKIGW
jgi:AAA lid domain